MPSWISKLSNNPKRLFKVDGIGAALSCASFIILSSISVDYLGIPKNILLALGGIAFLFCVTDILFWYIDAFVDKLGLTIMVIFNVFYCLLTLALLLVISKSITPLGLVYIITETTLIVFLILIEVKTILRIQKNHL